MRSLIRKSAEWLMLFVFLAGVSTLTREALTVLVPEWPTKGTLIGGALLSLVGLMAGVRLRFSAQKGRP